MSAIDFCPSWGSKAMHTVITRPQKNGAQNVDKELHDGISTLCSIAVTMIDRVQAVAERVVGQRPGVD